MLSKVYSNPSHQRSFSSVTLNDVKLSNMLTLNIGGRHITIVPQFEYIFYFYDEVYGTSRTLKALVLDIINNKIKVKYIQKENKDFLNCNKCHNKCSNWLKLSDEEKRKPMPTCNCILNPPDMSKYEGPQTIFIPIENLMGVEYVKSGKDKDCKKGDVKVMLLGISTTLLKAIIIRMEFFDDSLPEAVKLIDMKVGGIYDIAYQDKDGTIYESRAKVVKIEQGDEHELCKSGKGFVRECIGSDNSVYYCCDRRYRKEEFMQEPPVKKVRIIIDTSEDFAGRYETIMLDSIRDCTLVKDSEDDTELPIEDNICKCCKHKFEGCNKETCGHHVVKSCGDNCTCKKVYSFEDGNYTAILSKDKVHIDNNGEDPMDITVEDLVKFYLGLD